MNKYLRPALLGAILIFSLWACQADPDTGPIKVPKATQRLVVSAQDIPQVTATLLQKLGTRDALTQSSVNDGEAYTPFSIDWNYIKQLIDSTGRETYTFGMEVDDGNPATFYNLIMRYSENKEAHRPFILKYTMSDGFLPQYQATGSLQGFDGTVQKILIKGNTAGSNRRGNAAISPGGLTLGDPCPGTTAVGGSPGGGTDPDPNLPSITLECTTYVVTTTWYSQACSPAGCSDPIVIGQEESLQTECGWTTDGESADSNNDCGPDTGEIPIVEPEEDDLSNPCKLKKLMTENPSIVAKLQELKGKTGLNKEVGYKMRRKADGSYEFTSIEGNENKHEISFPHSGSISGLMHTHFNGGWSVPSDMDIVSLHKAYPFMDNPSKYFFAVVTAEETAYLISITDRIKFKAFGEKYLTNNNSGWYDLFRTAMKNAITVSNTNQTNELNLVKILSNYNSGLTLMRGDINNFSSWIKLSKNEDDSVKEKDCK